MQSRSSSSIPLTRERRKKKFTVRPIPRNYITVNQFRFLARQLARSLSMSPIVFADYCFLLFFYFYFLFALSISLLFSRLFALPLPQSPIVDGGGCASLVVVSYATVLLLERTAAATTTTSNLELHSIGGDVISIWRWVMENNQPKEVGCCC